VAQTAVPGPRRGVERAAGGRDGRAGLGFAAVGPLPGGPTGQVSIRIVHPGGAAGVLPVVFHFHSGGWILGDKDTNERLDRELANAPRAVVVFVDYTPAPDAHYPVQNEQAYTALQWVVANAADIGADPTRVALVGDSAGGNMTAALTLMAKERGGPQIAAQVLFYPVTDANLDTGTYQRYADGPWATREAMRWFWDSYLPDQSRRSEITASPLRATTEQLRGLPPALIINAEHDVLRDEGEAYARKLSQAGVPVTQVRNGGTIHDFVLLNPITDTPATAGSHCAGGQLPAQRPEILNWERHACLGRRPAARRVFPLAESAVPSGPG
jgi:acetyl esterase